MRPEHAPLAALVLAGGRSSRMGTPKDSVVLSDGRTMLDHVLGSLRPLRLPILISTTAQPPAALVATGLPLVPDAASHEGPLCAIAHALGSIATRGLLVVGCDQPLLSAPLLRRLLPPGADHRVAFFADPEGVSLAPLPGYYPSVVLPALMTAVAGGERSPRRWAAGQDLRHEILTAAQVGDLRSFNSREDLLSATLL